MAVVEGKSSGVPTYSFEILVLYKSTSYFFSFFLWLMWHEESLYTRVENEVVYMYFPSCFGLNGITGHLLPHIVHDMSDLQMDINWRSTSKHITVLRCLTTLTDMTDILSVGTVQPYGLKGRVWHFGIFAHALSGRQFEWYHSHINEWIRLI